VVFVCSEQSKSGVCVKEENPIKSPLMGFPHACLLPVTHRRLQSRYSIFITLIFTLCNSYILVLQKHIHTGLVHDTQNETKENIPKIIHCATNTEYTGSWRSIVVLIFST